MFILNNNYSRKDYFDRKHLGENKSIPALYMKTMSTGKHSHQMTLICCRAENTFYNASEKSSELMLLATDTHFGLSLYGELPLTPISCRACGVRKRCCPSAVGRSLNLLIWSGAKVSGMCSLCCCYRVASALHLRTPAISFRSVAEREIVELGSSIALMQLSLPLEARHPHLPLCSEITSAEEISIRGNLQNGGCIKFSFTPTSEN